MFGKWCNMKMVHFGHLFRMMESYPSVLTINEITDEKVDLLHSA